MFGRLIDVYVLSDNGDTLHLINSENKENNLKCSGTIHLFSGTTINKMALNIKNLSPVHRGEILSKLYNKIRVTFGYEDEDYVPATIFEGTVQRGIFQREDSNTTNTKLYVWDSGDFKSFGFFSKSYDVGVNYYQIALDIANEGKVPISTVLSRKLKEYTTKTPISFYGTQEDAFQKLADLTGLVYSTQNNTCYLLDPRDADSTAAISFTDEKIENGKTKIVSASGLIGIPKLTTDGLEFECLINPRLKIYSLIKMNNAIITNEQEGYEIPDVEFGATLDSEGLYRVVKIDIVFTNYNGDCRMKVKALARSSYDQLIN